jgi:PAS domain S-box-containing protein
MFRFNWDRTEFRITHLWEAEGIKKDDIVLPGLIIKDVFPWLFDNLVGGRDVIVPDIEILSTLEAGNEYRYCREMGIQSFIILPIEIENAPLCAIGLDAIRQKRKWPQEIQDRLRIIGEIFANTIVRRHVEKNSEEASLRYRTVADYTYDWEYWQNPDGSLQYISPSCERVCGYTVQDFMTNPSLLQDMIVPEDKAAWNEHRCSSQKGLKSGEIQFRIQRPDGEIRWIEHACQPVFDRQGNYQGVRASNRDITKREFYRSETHKLQSELAHMDRVVTISTLTSALAHEINQPLAAMRSYAQAALRFMDKDQPEYDSVREALQGIVADNKRAAEVVNRLRDLVKKGSTHRETIEINSIIKDVTGLINSELVLRNASITLDLHPSVPVVQGDSIQIQQVLINLLTNAMDAMNDQPIDTRTIAISTRSEDSNEIIVSISDSGGGIPSCTIKAIFSPFHTTKSTGMGLGLSICKSIIEAHGGKISAQNNPDGGAMFSIILPIGSQTM